MVGNKSGNRPNNTEQLEDTLGRKAARETPIPHAAYAP